MASKDNSVNLKGGAAAKAARAYHHGDLRAAVIAAGLDRLAEGDGAELGLRPLARDAGVSATALSRPFPPNAALLDPPADERVRRLGARQEREGAVVGTQGGG